MNKAIALLRVSTTKQYTQGDSPEEQLESIKPLEQQKQATIIKEFPIQISGTQTDETINSLLEYITKNEVKYIFVKNIDRFTRGGTRMYLTLFDFLESKGIEIVDSEGVISYERKNVLDIYDVKYDWSVYRPSEEQEIRKAQEAESERRRILQRVIGQEIRLSRFGYWIGGINYGYTTRKERTEHGRRSILYPLESQAKFIKLMYELVASGKYSDKQIIDQINELGYCSNEMVRGNYRGKNKLTVKQLYKYIRNPVYCGVRLMRRQRGKDKHGRVKMTLEPPVWIRGEYIVSTDLFNKANKGSIAVFDEDGKPIVAKGKIPIRSMFKNLYNELYPYKPYVLCPVCKNPKGMSASASTGKMKVKYPAYHCSRKHPRYGVPLKEFNKTIENFARQVELDGVAILRLKESYCRQYESSRKTATSNSDQINVRIREVENEQNSLVEKIELVNNRFVIERLEAKISKLESELIILQKARNKQETTKTKSQDEIDAFWNYINNFEKLVINADKPIQSAKFFSIMFKELPTYDELLAVTVGTLKLEPVFRLKQNSNLSVIRQGLEP